MAAINQYFFGNSLVNYAEGGSQTNVPIYLNQLAEAGGHTYATTGGYGFLRNFADRAEPLDNWSFDGVADGWDSDTESFAEAGFNSVVITPANFIQFQGPDADYPSDSRSPLDAVNNIVADVTAAYPDAQLLIYEGWSDLGLFSSSVPPSDAVLQAYHDYNQGEYHDWYVEFVNGINQADPDANAVLIPVAPVLADLFQGTLSDIPASDLYVDTAPHGTETTYFLASMVTYSAVYGEPAPAGFEVPANIDPRVAERYDELATEIADRVEFYQEGNSAPIPVTPPTADEPMMEDPAPEPEPEMPVMEDPAPEPEPERPVMEDPAPEPEPEMPVMEDPAPEPEPETPVMEDPAPEPEPETPVMEDPAPEPEPEMPVMEDPAPEPEPEMPVMEDPAPEPEPETPVMEDPAPEPEPEPPVMEEQPAEEMPPANSAPTAVADSLDVAFGEVVELEVLANDTDPDGDLLTLQAISAPAFGTAEIVDGRLIYTAPDDPSITEDRLSYSVMDGNGGMAQAEVIISLGAPEDDSPDVMPGRVPDDPNEDVPAADMPEGMSSTAFSVEYYALPSSVASLSEVDFDADPTATGNVDQLNFIDRTDPLWEGGPQDYFAARFTQEVTVEEAGAYRFLTYSDDGLALRIDGETIVGAEETSGYQLVEGEVFLEPGTYTVEVDYFERTGGQTLFMEWTSPTGAPLMDSLAREDDPIADDPMPEEPMAEEPMAEEPTGEDPMAEEPMADAPMADEPMAEAPIGEEPMDDDPMPEAPADEDPMPEEPEPEDDDEESEVEEDDDEDENDDVEEDEDDDNDDDEDDDGDVDEDDEVDDQEDEDEEDNGPVIDMAEGMTSTGYNVSYYALPSSVMSLSQVDFDADPTATGSVDQLNFLDETGPLWDGGPQDFFAARFTQEVTVEDSGVYRFLTYSDDGIELRVDGETIIGADETDGLQLVTGEIFLEAGTHSVEVDYYERTGEQTLFMEWTAPGGENLMDSLARADDATLEELAAEQRPAEEDIELA